MSAPMSSLEIEQTARDRRNLIFEYLLERPSRASTSEIMVGLDSYTDFKQYSYIMNRSTLLNDLNELRRQGKITLTKGEKSYYWKAVNV